MANGILIIDKPEGWTSHDVVAKLRGVFHEKRVGHAGTLDPMATGVLPVFFGRATRAVEFVAEGGKEYVAGLKLGVETATQDTTGTVLAQRPVTVGERELGAVLPQFTGPILQIPPMYSAIKKDGKKLYELARKGVEVERAPRPVTIYALTPEGQIGPDEYRLRIQCSKGTYVRTLCHDIGQALGCGGCMSALRRTVAAGYPLSDSVTMEQVLAHPSPETLLRPVETCFIRYPALTIEGRAVFQAKNGCAFSADAPDGVYRVYGEGGEFLLLGELAGGTVTTIKSFYEVQ